MSADRYNTCSMSVEHDGPKVILTITTPEKREGARQAPAERDTFKAGRLADLVQALVQTAARWGVYPASRRFVTRGEGLWGRWEAAGDAAQPPRRQAASTPASAATTTGIEVSSGQESQGPPAGDGAPVLVDSAMVEAAVLAAAVAVATDAQTDVAAEMAAVRSPRR